MVIIDDRGYGGPVYLKSSEDFLKRFELNSTFCMFGFFANGERVQACIHMHVCGNCRF